MAIEETRRVAIDIKCRGQQEIVPAWARKWGGASGRSRSVETEVGGGCQRAQAAAIVGEFVSYIGTSYMRPDRA